MLLKDIADILWLLLEIFSYSVALPDLLSCMGLIACSTSARVLEGLPVKTVLQVFFLQDLCCIESFTDLAILALKIKLFLQEKIEDNFQARISSDFARKLSYSIFLQNSCKILSFKKSFIFSARVAAD